MSTMKIDQSAFIRDLIIKKVLTNYNASIIPMKVGLSIKMLDSNDYEETDFHEYQWLIDKLMYLACRTRPDIAFAVE